MNKKYNAYSVGQLVDAAVKHTTGIVPQNPEYAAWAKSWLSGSRSAIKAWKVRSVIEVRTCFTVDSGPEGVSARQLVILHGGKNKELMRPSAAAAAQFLAESEAARDQVDRLGMTPVADRWRLRVDEAITQARGFAEEVLETLE